MSATPAPALTVSVIVSSYNYRDYVVQAVNSALAQSAPPLQVIVVDDGSHDDSWELLQRTYADEARVTLLHQANAGQMAAWIHGLAHASGDIVALLDSDDEWTPGYLERVLRVYHADPSVDYVYCNMQKFGSASGLALTRRRHRRSRDLGLSMLMGAFVQRWQGVATSGNTLRRELLQRILSLPAEQAAQWRTRPDDCLFYGSDILGAHKVYLAEPLVRHREHANNALLEFSRSPIKTARYAYRVERMLDHYRTLAGCSPYWLKMARREFQTKPAPSLSEWWIYSGFALRAPLRWSARLSQAGAITLHYLRSLPRRSGPGAP